MKERGGGGMLITIGINVCTNSHRGTDRHDIADIVPRHPPYPPISKIVAPPLICTG